MKKKNEYNTILILNNNYASYAECSEIVYEITRLEVNDNEK